jgi:redox-sensing transcriptional repressor
VEAYMGTISEPSRRRLVLLEQLLTQETAEHITSAVIEQQTGWTGALIRHDIASIGYRAGVSNGYRVRDLHDAICAALGITGAGTKRRCCIVGLGRLGAALLDDSIFSGTEFEIAAGFDPSVNRTEILRSTFPLYPAARLEQVVSAEHIAYAVLAVADSAAQTMAVRLAACGIKGIVNYTNSVVAVPPPCVVENVSPVTALRTIAARAAGENGK